MTETTTLTAFIMKKILLSLLLAAGAIAGATAVANYAKAPASVNAAADWENLTPDDVRDPNGVFKLEDGKPVIVLTTTAPWYDSNKNPLPEDTRMSIEVTRYDYETWTNEGVIYTSEAIYAPGEEIVFTDRTCVLGGDYRYNIIACIGDHKSSKYAGACTIMAAVIPPKAAYFDGASEYGKAPISLELVANTLNADGTEFDFDINRIYISRVALEIESYSQSAEEVVKEWNGPFENGEKLYFDDYDVQEGYKYAYYAYQECALGKSNAYPSGYIMLGPDKPKNVSDLKVEPMENNNVLITWTESNKGYDGGYVDLSQVTYEVQRCYSYSEAISLGTVTGETRFVDNLDDLDRQVSIFYRVIPSNSVGVGYDRTSDSFVAGPADQLPFYEYFNKRTSYSAGAEHIWSNTEIAGGASWYTSTMGYIDVDGDYVTVRPMDYNEADYAADALVTCMLYETGNPMEAYYTSGDISLEGHSNPVLTFYYYAVPNSDTRLGVDIVGHYDGESGIMPLADDVEEESYSLWESTLGATGETGWTKVTVNIQGFSNTPSVRLRFVGGCDADTRNITSLLVDNISIVDYPMPTDLECDLYGSDLMFAWNLDDTADVYPDHYVIMKDNEVIYDDYPAYFTFTTLPYEAGMAPFWFRIYAVYIVDGEEIPTPEASLYVDPLVVGVEQLDAAGGETIYFNLQGMPVAEPADGQIVIRRTVGADGAVSVRKVMVRK